MGVDFRAYANVDFFKSTSGDKDKRLAFGGVVSTELKDKQAETLIQKGLDFGPFMKSGHYNDNHQPGAYNIMGYPKPNSLRRFQKGETLPSGRVAPANCTWVEGYLLDTAKGRQTWENGIALQKAGSPRQIGFSIEGKVLERAAADRSIVVKAVVTRIAITEVPVGEETGMECLAKSLSAIAKGEDIDKALTMSGAGLPTPGTNPSAAGPVTGEGAGSIVVRQSLEDDEKDQTDAKTLAKSAVLTKIKSRFPMANDAFLERAYAALIHKAEQGLL